MFVALEGGDGSGKSGALAHLGAVLGEGALLTREPGGTDEGQAIRGLRLARGGHDWEPQAELLLIAAARAQHVARVIRPALAAGRVVVCDRYVGSTLAYQGAGRGLPIEELRQACDLAAGGRWPDLSVLLDLPPEVAERRRAAQQAQLPGVSPDRFEAEEPEFHLRVGEGFRKIAANDTAHWVVIDGSGSASEVAAEVLGAVRARLGIDGSL